MARVMAVWAIDIGQSALKALKLVPSETPEFVVAEAFDFIEYPKILSQPDAEPEELVREALETFIGRNDLKGSRVAVAVPGQAGLVKFIKLPPVEKKRIPDIVKFEARQQIPFALEEVIWDYQPIGGQDAGEEEDDAFTMPEVGLFAMKRDQIYRAIQPLKAAGIEVDIVQMSPLSLFNFAAFDRLSGEEKPEGSIVLLDVGADNTDLIITDGTRIWQRNVPIGGNHFTRALTKELKLTFAKAEHLKRNATKSQDPRAVFTAMRNVFGDLSSEVSRSIGFYSSVNRQAKISKIIGLGNGFKLPGLQKFLQQNLNYDVDKLENFQRMAGEDVVTSPQFTDNLMSYAVAYGLGLQGLELAPLKTNLLPPEIEQVRMIRRKKPWALATAALLMMGFTILFLGSWSALAKVDNPAMDRAVAQAKSVASTGDQRVNAYDTAKGTFEAKKKEGLLLVEPAAETVDWVDLLMTVNRTLPNPSFELGIDPSAPENQEILSLLRIHIDAILPRYTTDVGQWYAGLPSDPVDFRDFMHPLDRSEAPTGAGWVIHVIGHHYNPPMYGTGSEKLQAIKAKEQELGGNRRIIYGPLEYLVQQVVPRFWRPVLRQQGIHHATVEWLDEPDFVWETSKLASGSAVPKAPLSIARPAPLTPGSGGGGYSGAGSDGMGSGMESMMSSMGAGMGMMGYGGGREMRDEGYDMMSGGMGAMMGYGMGMMGQGMGAMTKGQPEKSTLTRTNFMVSFVWQPPEAGTEPPAIETIVAKLDEAFQKAGPDAIKTITEEDAAAVAKQSGQRQQEALKKQIEAVQGAAAAAGDAPEGVAEPPAAGTAPPPGQPPAPPQ